MSIVNWKQTKFSSIRADLNLPLVGGLDKEGAKQVADKYVEMVKPVIPALCQATNLSETNIDDILTEDVPMLVAMDTTHLTSIYNVTTGSQFPFQNEDEPLRQSGLIDYGYCFSSGFHKRNIIFTKYGLEVFLVLAIADTLCDVYMVAQSYMSSLESLD